MRIESLQVELRPRSPWEAVELGMALVRTHAAAIWKPWLLVTLPVLAIVDAAALAIDQVWIGWLVMWWLTPLFDRIPLFVLSRAVFGDAPTLRATLAAQRTWGWRAMWPLLTWRRVGLTRAVALPVDLLEGSEPKRLRERRRVLGAGIAGHVSVLTLVCIAFVVALVVSVLALGALLIPWEWILNESARAAWRLLIDAPPPWTLVAMHVLVWAALSVIEPFYVGAGFGLYLNRRTQIEAWDVEIALRRLRTRLATTASAFAIAVIAACAWPLPGQATGREPTAQARASAAHDAQATRDDTADAAAGDDDAPSADADAATDEDATDDDATESTATLADVFGRRTVDDPAFRKAVAKAYTDPLLRPKRAETFWELRNKKTTKTAPPPKFQWLANLAGILGEAGLWIVLGALVLALALTAKRWWPWVSGLGTRAAEPSPVAKSDAALPDVLPPDIASAARALWAEGRPRRALALLYRASVEAMAQRADVLLVPGATESECLRASRRMPDAGDRDVFARIVRVWQYAAYAQRLPERDDFDGLVGALATRFGWAR